MVVYGVFEAEMCQAGDVCEGHTIDELKHICATEEKAYGYLTEWAVFHPGCEIQDNNAIRYYDDCFCMNTALVPVTEDVYLKNANWGGYQNCYIKRLEVEE